MRTRFRTSGFNSTWRSAAGDLPQEFPKNKYLDLLSDENRPMNEIYFAKNELKDIWLPFYPPKIAEQDLIIAQNPQSGSIQQKAKRQTAINNKGLIQDWMADVNKMIYRIDQRIAYAGRRGDIGLGTEQTSVYVEPVIKNKGGGDTSTTIHTPATIPTQTQDTAQTQTTQTSNESIAEGMSTTMKWVIGGALVNYHQLKHDGFGDKHKL